MHPTVTVLVLAAPVVLVACGGSKKKPSVTPAVAVRQAAQKTAAQGSEHMALRGTVLVSGQQVTVSGLGDFKRSDGTLHVDFNAGVIAGTLDAVRAGTRLYMHSPLLSTTLPSGKTWLAVDLGRSPGTIGGLPLTSLAGQSPAQTLATVGSLTGVSDLGAAQLSGVSTTHYRGRAKGKGVYDVWVGDADGYVHKVKYSTTLAPGETLDATIDLSDFGKRVTIVVPPASQTETRG